MSVIEVIVTTNLSILCRNLTCNEAQDSPIVGKILVDYVVTQVRLMASSIMYSNDVLSNTFVVGCTWTNLHTRIEEHGCC